jgi:hypothetical protein
MPTDPLRNSLVDQVTTQDLNFHQRRITNAHPSIDDYDYVVRRELRKLQEDLLKKVTTIGGGGADTETHVFGVSGDVALCTNGFPPLIIQHNVTLVQVNTVFLHPPVGANFTALIRIQELFRPVILSITIPNGSYNIVEYTTFGRTSFKKGDILTCDITQIGSEGSEGSMWTAYMLFKVTGV